MQPLLKISSIPIKIEAQTKRAALQHNAEPPRVNVTRTRGAANIRTTPAKVNIDTTEARANSGLKSPMRSTADFAAAGRALAQEATRNLAEEGNAYVDSMGKGEPIIDNAAARASYDPDIPEYGPPQAPQINVQPASISFNYQMDSLTFDWNINQRPQLEYVPGSIEYSVAQYPDVVIEYLGSPIYVPRSADPNYVPGPGE
jgi:hypothetical protein